MSPPAKLIERIRKTSRPGTWSQGVNLVRANAVALESRDEDEIVLRVRAPGRAVAPTVVLYPGEVEYECDCPSRVSPCEHVAAAAIALSQAEQTVEAGAAPQALPSAAAVWGRVVYRFTRDDAGLRLSRTIARSGEADERPLEGTLGALLSSPAEAAGLQVEQADLQADRLLETRARGVLPADKLLALVQVLAGARNVFLDGRPVVVAESELLPRAVVEDRGDEVVLTIARDPSVTAVLSAGIALCGDVIQRLGETELTGAWLQHLPKVRAFAPREIGELTTRVLPDLSRRMAVDVRSARLPRIVRDLPPRLLLEMDHLGSGLAVLPLLVYGSPPCARIDEGRMVYLRGPVPVRDEAAERRLLQSLRDDLNLMPGRRVSFQGADAARFATKLRSWRGDLAGDAVGVVGTDARLEPRLAVQALPATAGGAPQVRFELSFAVIDAEGQVGRTVDAADVVRAWRDGLGFVALEGGGWAPLPQAWLERHGERLADLLAARDAAGRLANHALPALGALCHDLDHPSPPGLDRLAPLVEGFSRLSEPELPGDLTAELRPYQRAGVSWLQFLRSAGLGGVLADDMGLGKTLQSLCVLGPRAGAPAGSAPRGALIVCPTSVLPNWEAEIRRFRPALRVLRYAGPGRRLDDSADVTLTSYALLRLDADRLAERPWQTVILDEAQAIKNPDSEVARAAYTLKADLRLALTGTPLENRLDELWSLLHFTNPGLLGGRRAFDDRFAVPIAKGETGAAERLRQRIRPFVLRRLKTEVAPDLPPRTEAVLRIDLDERERAVYDAVRAATRPEVVALLDGRGGVMKALEALLRLRQAACHPALVPGQQAASSSKVQALVEALRSVVAEGRKALVFSQWTSFLDLIEPAISGAEIGFVRLDGSTRDRAGVISSFQDAEGPPVMLISLKAGGTGVNLTSADHVFLCDPWWNPAVEAQAADRAHRIGQERPVLIYRLVALGTVEERILNLQSQKRALFEAAMGEGGAAAGLTRDDLLALLHEA